MVLIMYVHTSDIIVDHIIDIVISKQKTLLKHIDDIDVQYENSQHVLKELNHFIVKHLACSNISENTHQIFLAVYLSTVYVLYASQQNSLKDTLFNMKKSKNNINLKYFYTAETNLKLVEAEKIVKDIGSKKLDTMAVKSFLIDLDDDRKKTLESNPDTNTLVKMVVHNFLYQFMRGQLFKEIVHQCEEVTMQLVVPVRQEVSQTSYTTIEYMLAKLEKDNILKNIDNLENFVSDFYYLSRKKNTASTGDWQTLFETKTLIPITDELVRIHRDQLKSYGNENQRRIDFIVERTLAMKQKFDKTKTGSTIKFDDERQRAMFMNYIIELGILKRIYNQGKLKIEDEAFDDFIKFMPWAYSNFDPTERKSLTIQSKSPIQSVRYATICYMIKSSTTSMQKSQIDMRNIRPGEEIDMVGVVVPHKMAENLLSYHLNNVVADRVAFRRHLYNIISGNKNPKSYYILFENLPDALSPQQFIQNLYQDAGDIVHLRLQNFIKQNQQLNIHKYLSYADNLESTSGIKIPEEHKYSSISSMFKAIPLYDEEKVRQVNQDSSKIPITLNKPSPSKYEQIFKNRTCQHFIDWNSMRNESNTERRETVIYEFIKKFAVQVFNEERVKHVVCKSCGTILNISNYLVDGQYDSAGNYITFYSVRSINLRDTARYGNLPKMIDYLDNALQLICENLGLNQYSGYTRRPEREVITKQAFDLLQFQNQLVQDVTQFGKMQRSWLIEIDIYSIENDPLLDTSKYFTNVVLVYLLISLFFNMNEMDIVQMRQTKQFNVNTFLQIKDKKGFFTDYNVIKEISKLSEGALTDYPVLAYLFFRLSLGLLTCGSLWHSQNKIKKGNMTSEFIEDLTDIFATMIHLLNRILHQQPKTISSMLGEGNQQESQKLFEVFHIKYFSKLSDLYVNEHLIASLQKAYEKSTSPDLDLDLGTDTASNVIQVEDNAVQNERTALHRVFDIIPYMNDWQTTKFLKKKAGKFDTVSLSSKLVCQNGIIHEWNTVNGDLKCTHCGIYFHDVKAQNLHDTYHARDLNEALTFIKENTTAKIDISTKNIESAKKELKYQYRHPVETRSIDQQYSLTRIKDNKSSLSEIIGKLVNNLDKICNQIFRKKFNFHVDNFQLTFKYNGKDRKPDEYISIRYDKIKEGSKLDLKHFEKPVLFYYVQEEKTYYFFYQKNLRFAGYRPDRKGYITILEQPLDRYLYLRQKSSFFTLCRYIGLQPEYQIRPDRIPKEEYRNVLNQRVINMKTMLRMIVLYIFQLDKNIPTSYELYPYLKLYSYQLPVLKSTNYFKELNTMFSLQSKCTETEKGFISFMNSDITAKEILYYFYSELVRLLNDHETDHDMFLFVFELIKYVNDLEFPDQDMPEIIYQYLLYEFNDADQYYMIDTMGEKGYQIIKDMYKDNPEEAEQIIENMYGDTEENEEIAIENAATITSQEVTDSEDMTEDEYESKDAVENGYDYADNDNHLEEDDDIVEGDWSD